jgi:hypothetical protein
MKPNETGRLAEISLFISPHITFPCDIETPVNWGLPEPFPRRITFITLFEKPTLCLRSNLIYMTYSRARFKLAAVPQTARSNHAPTDQKSSTPDHRSIEGRSILAGRLGLPGSA